LKKKLVETELMVTGESLSASTAGLASSVAASASRLTSPSPSPQRDADFLGEV
jgi:hypothetical protein